MTSTPSYNPIASPVRTALYRQHLAHHAKMVDFHGWDLALHYGSQLQEHRAVRQNSGIFDVSHMTIIDLCGEGAQYFLRKLLTADISKLSMQRALYCCMCNEQGGILDDLIVYRIASTGYRLVLNAATRLPDLAWIQHQSEAHAIELHERTDLAMVAIQGPKAIEQALTIFHQQADAIRQLTTFSCLAFENFFIARTGYTGEDGIEIITSLENIAHVWQAFLAAGAQPCGLAARDSLRIEAGLLLYGQDMDATTTPLESALGWTIDWKPEDRSFIGREALVAQKKQGPRHKLIGLTLQDKGVMRNGQAVKIENLAEEGIITSGTFSPLLEHSIGFARVPFAAGSNVWVNIRDTYHPAHVGRLRFIK